MSLTPSLRVPGTRGSSSLAKRQKSVSWATNIASFQGDTVHTRTERDAKGSASTERSTSKPVGEEVDSDEDIVFSDDEETDEDMPASQKT